jgi:hypothetical protein
MGSVQTELQGKKVFLLNGTYTEKQSEKAPEIEAPDDLLAAARRDPDAVAFGYVSGRWVAAA